MSAKLTKEQRIKLARFALKHPEHKTRIATVLKRAAMDRRQMQILFLIKGFEGFINALKTGQSPKDRAVDVVTLAIRTLNFLGYKKEARKLSPILSSIIR